MVNIDRNLYRKLNKVFMTAFADKGNRKAILAASLPDNTNLPNLIQYEGNAMVFSAGLIQTLKNFGTIDGRHVVLYVLDGIDDMGVAGEHDDLIAEIRQAMGDTGGNQPSASSPPPAPNGSQEFNIGDVSGKTINIGGTVNIYGNAPDVPSPAETPAAQPARPQQSKAAVTRDQVFISYSHKETDWMKDLMTSLRPRMRGGAISVWTDEKIQVGDRWRDEINAALASARVAVLMVSRNFLASDFIMSKELPIILEAAKRDDLRVVWVPVTYSAVRDTQVSGTKISEYQAAGTPLLSPNNPLDSLSEADKNRALEMVAKDVVDAYNAVEAE